MDSSILAPGSGRLMIAALLLGIAAISASLYLIYCGVERLIAKRKQAQRDASEI